MARESKDRSGQWLLEHHAGVIVRVAGVRGFTSCKPAKTVLTHPKQLPDGVVEVFFPEEKEPSIFLLEISTYPDSGVNQQVLDDVAVVMLERKVITSGITLVLAQKGNLELKGQEVRTSKRGLTKVEFNWSVIELWKIPAADLFALDDAGALALVPLSQFDEPPEVILEQVRDGIEKKANPQEKENLIAIAMTLTTFRYNDEGLLGILTRKTAVLDDSPFIQKIMRDSTCRAKQESVIRFLRARFKSAPEEIVAGVRTVLDLDTLDELHDLAAVCLSVEAFRDELNKKLVANK